MAENSTLDNSYESTKSLTSTDMKVDQKVKQFILDYSRSINGIELKQGKIIEHLN
jgi:hypothetical protein